MYLPRRFAETDLRALDALFARDPFVTLVTVDSSGQPTASHLPVLYAREDERLTIRGHWARVNPQARHAGPALLICHGPHAYISPTWYTRPKQHVPTWNYAVAHLQGALRASDDIETKRRIVSELSARHESALGTPWQPAHGHPDFEPELDGIIGFDFEVSAVAMKFKLNQHHPAADVAGAIRGLRGVDRAGEREVAELMQSRLDRRGAKDTQGESG